MDFHAIIEENTVILTECAIAERLRRRKDVQLHPTLFNTPLIYDEVGSSTMKEIYGQYRTIAQNAGLPILLCAPTWRIDKTRIQEGGMGEELNRDAVKYMRGLQKEWQLQDSPVCIGGLIGPKNDCYSPKEALSVSEAEEYHGWQVDELVRAEVECIITQTIPAVSEALGLALLLAKTGVPYLISFVINRYAEVLDGTPLNEAVTIIDSETAMAPSGYMVNCAFPSFLHADSQPAKLFQRLIGFQANASSRDHDQLDGTEDLQQDSLKKWGDQMLRLNREFGVKILGGCCGTDDTYLNYLTHH